LKFESIRDDVSRFFALPEEKIFFANADGDILMNNMLIGPTLFPLLECSRADRDPPHVKVIFENNYQTLD
jgi:hypothetical protein